MNIRKALISDAKLLFDWVNESNVRRNAINTNPIKWDDHLAWFQNKLHTENSFVLIAEINNQPIGQIRFDFENNKFLIDYSIAKNERGNGYGFLIVKEGINYMKKNISKVKTYIAWVKSENTASKRVFEKLGFYTKSSLYKEQTELIIYELSL